MITQPLTDHQSQYVAWLLTRRAAGDSIESLASTLVDSQVDLNPHQVEAALFACRNPLSRGVILADEVGLGKTIEAGLVISQRWAERRRKVLIVVPANLRKQWHQELQDKFNLQALILEAKNYNAIRKQGQQNPFLTTSGPVICSYQFAKSKAQDIKQISWDLAVLDEAHRLRNVYKTSNVIAKTLKEAMAHVHSKVLLTATPLQNSLLELYGLVSMIDDRVFGDLDSFRTQFTAQGRDQTFTQLRERLASVCKRTLRRQVQPYVSYTARKAIVQEFTPSSEEQELSRLVAEYLRRPNLMALPQSQRQLISLVLWKLLASSTHAIAGALETMAKRLQGVLDATPVIDLSEELDEDYESLDETAEEFAEEDQGQAQDDAGSTQEERAAISHEIEELRHFKTLATNIRDNNKGKALLVALERAFEELNRLGAAKKAIIFTESKRTQAYLLGLLADTAYGAGIVLFNGTNSDARAQATYKDWLKRHDGTDRISGSKAALTAALNSELCKVEVVLAHTGGAIHDDRRHIFGDLERGFNGTNPGFVRCRSFGLTTLHDLHLSGASAGPIDAEVELRDFGYAERPYRAFYGRMHAKRLVELWSQYPEQLVDRNIRRFKGATTVNAGLSETLKAEADHFFYFNNGVTFLCSSIAEQHPRDANRQSGKFRVRGMSIINGAQTVGAIAKEPLAHYDEHPAEVLATFVCLEHAPDDFGDRVTQSRNRQNAVDLEDFAALDERQGGWQSTLRMAGITYLVKQGEDDPSLSPTCFSARELAPFLACAVTGGEWPHYVVAAKSDKKKLFGREGFVSAQDPLRHAYDNLFTDSLTARRMWRATLIGRIVIETVKARSNEPDPTGQPGGTLLAKDILGNAGWLILHVVFIRQSSLLDGAALHLTDAERQTLSEEIDRVAGRIVEVVQANTNWGKQARAVFENKTDCQTVKVRLMAALAQQS